MEFNFYAVLSSVLHKHHLNLGSASGKESRLNKKGVSYLIENGGGLTSQGNHQLNPNYITGFADGEGCFHITLARRSSNKTGYSVNLSFSIGLHRKDAYLLRSIQGYFGGIGVFSVTSDTVLWRVLSAKELKVIVDHFDRYPLITKKYLDFVLFKEALQLFINKSHLTGEGIVKMASIKASMNKGLSETLKEAFPNSGDPSSLPKGSMERGKNLNPF